MNSSNSCQARNPTSADDAEHGVSADPPGVVDDAEYKAFVEAGTNDTKISGRLSPAYFFLPAFSTDDYTSSAVYEAVKTMMDEVLVNFKDPAAAIEACLNSLK